MSIDFSPEIRQAGAVFKEYRNTIDIYTEDCDKDKEFYVRLLKKLLQGTGITINDIHPLGCRRSVIDCCINDTDTRRKRIYIIDGDIYLQYKDKEIIPNLFVLDAYCIENYMICEESICSAAYIFNGRESFESVKEKLHVLDALTDISTQLIDLFFYFSIQMQLYGQFCIKHIDEYMDKSACCLDVKKIENEINGIIDGLISHGILRNQIEDALSQRKQRFEYTIDTFLKIVSGKNYIIPYFKYYIEKKLNCKISIPKESWKFNMVETCDISKLDMLKEAIIAASV